MRSYIAFACFIIAALAAPAYADEGLWPFDAVPATAIGQTYGLTPTAGFVQHLRASALRLGDGCTASFVSSQGLIMTSHHCVTDCVALAATPEHNYVETGFNARGGGDERPCANTEVDQLVHIDDVTKTILAAVAAPGASRAAALADARAAVVRSCGTDPAVLCEVVSLYDGGVYDLYRYKRFTDVRLVFAPEFSVAQFGGDAATFDFPRYDFDIGFLRAYERGRPAFTPDFLRWSKTATKPGDLVFAAANPGPSQRRFTSTELGFERRYRYPMEVPRLAEYRGLLEGFEARGGGPEDDATGPLYGAQNALRRDLGEQRALEDPQFIARRLDEEAALRSAVAANPLLQAADGSAWDDVATLQTLRAHLFASYESVSGDTFDQGLLGVARTLVRAAAERKKLDAQRLAGFSDAALALVRRQLSLPTPNHARVEELSLAFGLEKLRENLGADDPLVQSFLGKESPQALAHRLISGTKLGDPAVRLALFDGGQAAIDASMDPLIAYARYVDEDVRTVLKDYDSRVGAPMLTAAARIAHARFALYGQSVAPDGTHTPRFGYGSIAGFDANGTPVKPYTTIGGLFDGATASPPYALPPSWLAAKPALDLSMPMNVATTIDSVGGDSGRPLVDRDGRVVGLLSGGNSASLGTVFGFDPLVDRAVALDGRAIVAGLEKVYHADRITAELERPNRPRFELFNR